MDAGAVPHAQKHWGMLRVLVLGAAAWGSVGLLLALVVGRGGRRSGGELSMPTRAAVTTPPVPVADAWDSDAAAVYARGMAVATHGLRASAAIVAGSGANLLESWGQLDERLRTQILETLVAQASLLESQIEDLLRDVPVGLRTALDELVDERSAEALRRVAALERTLATVGGGGGLAAPIASAAEQDLAAADAPIAEADATPITPVVPLRRRPSLAAPLAAAAAAAALVVVTATTMNGALPAVAQDPIANLADRVGIDLPTSREDVVRVARATSADRSDAAEPAPSTQPANDDAAPIVPTEAPAAPPADAPGHDPAGPGRSEETPAATSPGRSEEAPGRADDAPGRSEDAPGRSEDAPGRAAADRRGRTPSR